MSRPTQALPAALAAPIDATVTSFPIRGLKDSLGNPIVSMIGTVMHATIEPRSTSNQEIISWTSITDLGNNLITVGGVTRNIDPRYPHAALTGTMNHANGVEIILSDTSKMWSEYPNVNEVNTINALQNFAVRPRSTGTDTDPSALVTKAELAAASITPGALGNITASAVAGEAVTAQYVVWNDPTVGKWKIANGNVLAELENTALGIALGSAVTDAAITPGVALHGRVSGFTGLSVGAVYVSDTGTVSNTPGTNSLQIGIALSASDILFDPIFKRVPTLSGTQFLNGTTGIFFPYGGSAAPTGFLLCDGSAVSRTTYAALFAVLGTANGVGDGSTTFNLPDGRGRTFIGAGTGTKVATFASRSGNVITVTGLTNAANNEFQTGQAIVYTSAGAVMTGLTSGVTYYLIRTGNLTFSLAATLANAQSGTAIALSSDGSGVQTFTLTLTTRTVGATGGEENHAISNTETLLHAHDIATNAGTGTAGRVATGSTTSSATATTASFGGNVAMNNMQPSFAGNWIVKT